MKMLPIAALSFAAAISLSAIGEEPEGTVLELKDGSRIVLQKDGKTYHADAGKDGHKYLMKSDAIWKQISEKGTVAPNR